jgi:hypothetical protein
VSTRYTPESYKNTHGHVLIAAGSRGYSGAAALAGNAAIRSGAGLVTIATPSSAQTSVASSAMPEVITTALAETDRGAVSDEAADHFLKLAEKATVVAVGPGLTSDDERTRHFVRTIVERRSNAVRDRCDGLNSLAPWPANLKGSDEHPLVLTPHPGEMLRLMGAENKSALDDRVAAAREFATAHQRDSCSQRLASARCDAGRSRIYQSDRQRRTRHRRRGRHSHRSHLRLSRSSLRNSRRSRRSNRRHHCRTLRRRPAGDFAAKELGMRTMVASDIREHFTDAIRFLDPLGEQP